MGSFTVREISRNVHEIFFEGIASDWEQYIMLTADRHHDNLMCDRSLEKKQLELARERQAPIIDVGDLFCAMQGRYDPRSSDTALRPEHHGDNYFDLLLDTAEDFYRPYADLFAVLGRGNHESSVLTRNQIDLTRNLSRRLGQHAPGKAYAGGYGGWILLRFKIQKTVRQTIKLRYYHGSGGGGPVTKGVIQTNRRAVYLPDADIIVTGHIHETWSFPIRRERLSGGDKMYSDYQWHVSLPTYKEEYADGYGGFHIERGRPPKPLGCGWIKLTVDGGRSRVEPQIVLDLH
jgi:hypothetical protein